MSEVVNEQTPPEQPTPEPPQPTSFPVSLILSPSGREHGVDGGASMDLIRDADGNPETDYVLAAEIDGVQVPLQTFSKTVLDQLAASEKARTESLSSG